MDIAMSDRGLRIHQVLCVLLVVLLGVFGICDGEQKVESRAPTGSSNLMEVEGRSERSQKVRAKWKGEQFWTSLTANLTQLEHQKAVEESANGMPSQRSGMNFKKSHSSSSKAKKGQSKNKKGSSHRHRHRPRSASKSSSVTSTTTQQPSKSKTTLVPEHKTTIATTTKSSSEAPTSTSTSTASTTTINSAEDLSGSAGQISPSETKSPTTSTTGIVPPKPTVEPLDRSTLIADLGPYQDFYLEYESNEEDDPVPLAPQKSTTTEMPSLTTETSTNSSALKITFLPKTPVNLLYLLQAYASNMKPIELKSPLANGPSVTIPPTVPLRVPVTVNPPNSPFLFNLDLDNFFTRMAISFFYSSIAIAPMIYLLLNSIGSLAGLSIVPFSGGRRKRSFPQEIFEGKDVEGLLDQVMTLFDSFMHGDLNESSENINEDSKDSSVSLSEEDTSLNQSNSSSSSSHVLRHNFFEIPTKLFD